MLQALKFYKVSSMDGVLALLLLCLTQKADWKKVAFTKYPFPLSYRMMVQQDHGDLHEVQLCLSGIIGNKQTAPIINEL